MKRLAVVVLAALHASGGTLSVHMDAPARVYLTDATGKASFAQNAIVYDRVRADGIAERHFVPRQLDWTIELPAGEYVLTAERGKEFLPFTTRIAIPAQGSVRTNVALKRWVDMGAQGWYSADMHVHRALQDLPLLMQAEDLNVAIPMTTWMAGRNQHSDPDLPNFLAQADADGVYHVDRRRFFPLMNEELEPTGSALLGSWMGNRAVAIRYPLSRFADAVHEAGGLVDLEKPTSLEAPALAALNAVDTIGLVNNHLWRSGSYTESWGAWPDRMLGMYPHSCAGFVEAGFEFYAALLNAGFKIVPSAGSASGVHPVPRGWSRVYVHVDGDLGPRAWLDSLRAGYSFVTTGPMLLLKVHKHEAAVRVLSPRPISTVQLVINGRAADVHLRSAGEYEYRANVPLDVKSTSWIAARYVQTRSDGCDAAHTAPVWVDIANAPFQVNRRSTEALLARVNQLISDVEAGQLHREMMLDTPQLRDETLVYLRRAHDVYEQLLSTPTLR